MQKLLYIDACINRDQSRTEALAQAYLRKRKVRGDCTVETLVLEDLPQETLDSKRLAERARLIAEGRFGAENFALARKFAQADELLIAAPYWDLSFPAALKIFAENICIAGLTFRYAPDGRPEGLTKITKATYITTAGGFIGKNNFGYEYINALLTQLFGVPEVAFFSAEGLDIEGNDPAELLRAAIERITL